MKFIFEIKKLSKQIVVINFTVIINKLCIIKAVDVNTWDSMMNVSILVSMYER